jgi:hypothetical protein
VTEFLPRSAWTDDPFPSGATLLVPSEVLGLAVHWPGGAGSVPTTRTASIQILNGELRFHTDPVSAGGRGWSDIAYSYAADQEGRVWELRGWQRRSAANGDTDVNREYLAVTCLVGPKDVPSPALLQAVRDLRSQVVLRHYPKATKVVPHSAIRPDPTDCPGDRLRAHIAAGTFTSTEEIDMALDTEDLANVRRQAFLGIQDYFERPGAPTRDIGDGAQSVPLRMLEWAAREARAGRVTGQQGRDAVLALGTSLAGLDVVDEQALAEHLAPLLASVLSDGDQVRHVSDADLSAIAKACADETARRQVA